MQSSPQCGAINNLSSTWTWLVISSLLGTSGFLKQLRAPVAIWNLRARFLSAPGSGAVILYLILANSVLVPSLGWWVPCGTGWLQRNLWCLRVGCLWTRFCTRGPPRVSSQGVLPGPREGLSKLPILQDGLQSPCKAVGNAADEVSAWH